VKEKEMLPCALPIVIMMGMLRLALASAIIEEKPQDV
jgi:hypothetical protein